MKRALLVIDVQQFYINEFTNHIPERIKEYVDKNSFEYIIFLDL